MNEAIHPFTPAARFIEEHDHPSQRLRSVLIVDDEAGVVNLLRQGLKPDFSLLETVDNAAAADSLLARCHFDLIIVDVGLPGRSGVDWIAERREQGCTTPVIFLAADAEFDSAVGALRAGASDFILKPFRLDQVQAAVENCMERRRIQRDNFVLHRQLDQIHDRGGIIGSCDTIRGLCEVIKRIAPMPSTVLIHGESGTGKELAARAIHLNSGRPGSFVPVNCASISAELLESELFGHVKGAFTGAIKAREGLFSYAEGGTLFLDEIGEMPLAMQTRLLRVLEDHRIRPVGSNKETAVDVRIVAATNRDLKEGVESGNFREDLYYRLNVLSIRMPSLRERLQDIPELVRHFTTTLAVELGAPVPQVTESELERLRRYDWPGNVRELRNVIERCMLLNNQPSQCLSGLGAHREPVDEPQDPSADDLSLEAIERRHILHVLELEGGNKSAAARRLEVSRKTLERKCQAWGVGG